MQIAETTGNRLEEDDEFPVEKYTQLPKELGLIFRGFATIGKCCCLK